MEDKQRIVILEAIIEEKQTEHWDIDCCPCWFCKAARKAGCKPKEKYLPHKKQEKDQ